MAKGQSLQDPFLNALRKERVPVSIYLVNGIKLQGQIDSFDQFVVLLKNSVSQMVYKHAISTVVPARNVRLSSEEGGEGAPETSADCCSSAPGAVSVRCWCVSAWAPPSTRKTCGNLPSWRSRPARCPWRRSPDGASVRTRAISWAAARRRSCATLRTGTRLM